MNARSVFLKAALVALIVPLTACSPLPREAKEAVLHPFDPEEQPRILSVHRGDLLPEDTEAGVEEIWCVKVVYRCWSCPHAEWRTCVSGYLVRRVGGAWQSAEMTTEEDWESWEARGCPPEP